MSKLYSKVVASVFAALTLVVGQSAVFNLNVDTWKNDNALFGGTATISTDSGANWSSVGAGQFQATFVGGVYDGYPQSWFTYCTDALLPLKSGYYVPLSWTDAEDAYHNPAWIDGGSALASSIYQAYDGNVGSLGEINSDAQAVGLQLAIWNALYNGNDWESATRLFQVTSAPAGAVTFVDTIYGNLNNIEIQFPAQSGTWWMPSDSLGEQRRNQGLIGPTFPSQRVPEPGTTMASLMVGLGFLAFARRKLVS